VAELYDPDQGRPGKLSTRWGGFADHIDAFDSDFFGISPREAVLIDPQQRLLLEVVWEMLEDAGLPADRLVGSKTGVFIGISTHDYSDLQANPANWHRVDTYSSTGTASSIAANRISYAYDLRGPSFVVDTACSSSLTAIHLACRSLREGDCDLAIAGGVNAFLSPATSIGFSRALMLSPDGRCKAFDAGANGFVRGEGAGVVILKPLAAAMADGDNIYAVVRGTAINQDGRTVGLMVPSADAQEVLIREALRDAGVVAGEVQYVEAHGTGTRVGDPIEAEAIARALSNGRGIGNPCLIGSVKTNIGHLEAAAGIAGVIKAALVLKHRMIPPSLHFNSANPAIPLEDLRLQVVTALQAWPGNGSRALAGVNSFGFGGANAHAILEEPPQNGSQAVSEGESVQILPISARHSRALHELCRRYRNVITGPKAPPLGDLCYSAAMRRSHHWQRAAFVGASREELVEQIDVFLLRENEDLPKTAGRGARAQEPKLAFVFTGLGPQWWGMGRQLFDAESVFRSAIEECDRLFQGIGTWALMEALWVEESHSRVQEPNLAPVVNLAIQVGLTRLWRSWGIIPDALIGHSAGEIGAAWAAGALSLEDALKVAFHRGQLQHRLVGSGTMLAAGVSENEAIQLTEGLSDRVSIAAINSPTSVTFSGERRALGQIAVALDGQQRFNRFLPVEVPYHAPCLESLRSEFIELLASLAPRPVVVPLISTVSGRWFAETLADADYWYDNLRRPVRFAEAIDRLTQEEYDLFLEIGPHPVLAASIVECLSARSRTGTVLPSLRRKEEERRTLLRSLAAIYNRGRRVDWTGVCQRGRFVSLPHYPWQRERYWFGGEQGASYTSSGVDSGHPLLGYRLRSVRPCWEVDLGQPSLDYLDDHIVQGSPVFPGAAYAEIALEAAKAVAPDSVGLIEEVAFRKVLFLTHRKETLLQFLHDPQSSSFEIYSLTKSDGAAWTPHATGKLRVRTAEPARRTVDLSQIRDRCKSEMPVAEAYQALRVRGLRHEGMFRGMEALWRGNGEALARIVRQPGSQPGARAYQVHPALLDSAFQAMLTAAESAGGVGPKAQGLFLPISFKRLTLWHDPGAEFWSHATITRFEPDAVESDITVMGDEGDVALAIEGLRCKALEAKAKSTQAALDELLYQLQWESKPLQKRPLCEVIEIRGAAELGVRMQPVADRLASERNWSEQLQRSEPLASGIAAHFARAALISLGWDPHQPLPSDTQMLADRLGIAQRHRRFFGRMLDIARTVSGSEATDGSSALERAAAEQLCTRILEEFPECVAVVDLLRRCGERLEAILTDAVDARQVLFAPEAMASWVRFFVDIPWFDFYNLLVAETIAEAVEEVPPNAQLRILEIGAGTGGTTLPVLQQLTNRKIDYHFTDISTYFLARARDRFRDRPHVQVNVLDIEVDPIPQLGSEPFDIVLAANVLHATADLRTALKHVRQLLAPGGLLVLLELSSKRPWVDLIFGITEGWWHFTDFDLRPDYPVLAPQQWKNVLAEAGFEGAAAVSESHEGNPFHAVLLGTLPRNAGSSNERRVAKDWMVCLDSSGVGARVIASLRKRGDRCVSVKHGDDFVRCNLETVEMPLDRPDHVARLVKELAAEGFGFHGVIQASSVDGSDPEGLTASQVVTISQTLCGNAIALVQGFEQAGQRLPPVWLLTSDTQAVEPGEAGANLVQAPLWGLGRVMSSELPGVLCRLVDLNLRIEENEIQALLDELEAGDFEEEVVLRGSQRYVARLKRRCLADLRWTSQVRQLSPDLRQFRLDVDTPGTLESLTLRETVSRRPGPGEVLIRVFAAGLNFRDVMLSLGMLPPMSIPGAAGKTILGFECAGIVIQCGEGVEEFRPGDEVMAVAIGALASQVITRAEMVARKPAHLTFEQAATMPQVFITAHYGLNHLARLSAGERVLIHAATGGVGLAAIQLAKRVGAEIFATAGSPEKRAYLKAMGIKHVMDSRSLAFADEVLAATNGEGVDVVLNSLAGEAIPKGLSILRPYGRFLELGKRDIYADAPIGLLPFDKNLSFSAIAADRMLIDRPALVGSLAREVAAFVEDRALEPIPYTAFDLSQAEEALRFLAQAKHIGKLVLTVREVSYLVAPCLDRPICRPDATYLISGGLGGFGLAIARWLVEKGARHIVLMSRRGVPTVENESAFEALQAACTGIVVFKGDVGDENDVRRILDEIRETLPPLRGIVHAAMVLDDSPLATMTAEQFRTVVSPKVGGAWNLHRLTTQDNLDFFVLLASATSLLGAKGQGSYAAANHFLDALAPYRRSLGLPALAIDWGALGEVGYLSRHPVIMRHLIGHGIQDLTTTEATEGLEQALRHGVSQLAVMRIDWARYSSIDEASVLVKKSRRLAEFLSARQATTGDTLAERGSLVSLLSNSEPAMRQTLVERHVVEQVARVLGTSVQKVDPSLRLTEIGVDSLMAVELQTIVKRDFGVPLPLAVLLEGGTVAQLTTRVLEQFDSEAVPKPDTIPETSSPPSLEHAVDRALVEQEPFESSSFLGVETRDAALVTALPVPEATPAAGHLIETEREWPADQLVETTKEFGSVDKHWTPLQRFLKRALSAFFGLVARVEFTGLDNIPPSGPVLLACNHLSMIDLPLIVTIVPRRGTVIAADRLQALPWVRWFLDLGDSIYVRRGEADQEALSRGLAVLHAGGMLGIAPEGTRSRSRGLTRGHSGVAYLASAASAPILPVAAYGQEQIPRNLKRLRRTPVQVQIGPLIHLEAGEKSAAELRRDTDRVMKAIAAMLPPSYRGVYADVSE
jgi:1-acyl-sn-glycerol-3-phosphate acyltransferase